MESGRFKVFKHLNDWFEEFRLYHRKDGRVNKEGDDLMSATRYAVMMLRFARTNIPPRRRSYRTYDNMLVLAGGCPREGGVTAETPKQKFLARRQIREQSDAL